MSLRTALGISDDLASLPRRGTLPLFAAMVGGLASAVRGDEVSKARGKARVKAEKKKKKPSAAPGPAGPAGPIGPTGPEGPGANIAFNYRTSAFLTVPPDGAVTRTATCESGEKAIAGGGATFSDSRVITTSSYIGEQLDSWTAEFSRRDNGGPTDPVVYAFVMCFRSTGG